MTNIFIIVTNFIRNTQIVLKYIYCNHEHASMVPTVIKK